MKIVQKITKILQKDSLFDPQPSSIETFENVNIITNLFDIDPLTIFPIQDPSAFDPLNQSSESTLSLNQTSKNSLFDTDSSSKFPSKSQIHPKIVYHLMKICY
jgi:hypothetical protein